MVSCLLNITLSFASCPATPHTYTVYFDPHLVHYIVCPLLSLLKSFFFPSSLFLIFMSFVLFCVYTLSLVRGAFMTMVRENSPLEKISSSLPCWNVERLDSAQVSADNYSRGNFRNATVMSHQKFLHPPALIWSRLPYKKISEPAEIYTFLEHQWTKV